MKIVSEDVTISIDFVEGYKTYDDALGGLFSVNAEVRSATFSGVGKNIWYAYDEFEQFIHKLKILITKDHGTVMIQPPVEAKEDYDLYGDSLNLRFSVISAPYLACSVNLGVYRPDAYQVPSSQMLHISFGMSSTDVTGLIADFESFKEIVLEDLMRRAKEESED